MSRSIIHMLLHVHTLMIRLVCEEIHFHQGVQSCCHPKHYKQQPQNERATTHSVIIVT